MLWTIFIMLLILTVPLASFTTCDAQFRFLFD
jgi:hypothetical protein